MKGLSDNDSDNDDGNDGSWPYVNSRHPEGDHGGAGDGDAVVVIGCLGGQERGRKSIYTNSQSTVSAAVMLYTTYLC